MSRPEADADPLRGTGYTALRVLGRGGFGIVYEAQDPAGTRCAVKVLLNGFEADPSGADRLRLEADTLRRARTPHIVRSRGVGRTRDGAVFYAMELLEGRTLGARLREEGRMPLPEAMSFLLQALQGLGAAHQLGVVHRDIKPENLFLCGDGVLKILDFGIAKVVEATPEGPAPLAVPTAEGMLIGSLRWCSPEAIASMPVDGRTDLYSLGLVFHAMLTGQLAWSDIRDQVGLVRAQLMEMPASVDSVLPLDEAHLADALVEKLSAKKPEERFASAAEATHAVRVALRSLSAVSTAPLRKVALARVDATLAVVEAPTMEVTLSKDVEILANTTASPAEPPRAPAPSTKNQHAVRAPIRWSDERLWSFLVGLTFAVVVAILMLRSSWGTP